MARRPKPRYEPVEPSVPALTDLSEEEVWRDGGLTMKHAAAFIDRSYTVMKQLVRAKKVASKRDGKLRMVAKRSLTLYLANLPD